MSASPERGIVPLRAPASMSSSWAPDRGKLDYLKIDLVKDISSARYHACSTQQGSATCINVIPAWEAGLWAAPRAGEAAVEAPTADRSAGTAAVRSADAAGPECSIRARC